MKRFVNYMLITLVVIVLSGCVIQVSETDLILKRENLIETVHNEADHKTSETEIQEQEEMDFNTNLENSYDTEVEEEDSVDHSMSPLDSMKEDRAFGKLDLGQLVMNPGQELGSDLSFNIKVKGLGQPLSLYVFDEYGNLLHVLATEVEPFLHYDDTPLLDQYVHHVQVSGLNPSTDYDFVFYDGEFYSELLSYCTPGNEVDLMVFGDPQGYKLEHYEAFRQNFDIGLKQFPEWDMTIIAGDIVDKGDDLWQWDYFHKALGQRLYERPVLTAIGNHDVINGSNLYKSSFEYPDNGLAALKDRSFYIDIPGGRIGVWDTEKPSLFSQQAEWLKEIMEGQEGFRIILMHRSVYPVSYNEAYIRNLSQVFEDLEIDMVISGHDHIYSRTTIMDEEIVSVDDGVTYVVAGSSSGSKFYSDLGDERFWKQVVFDKNYPVFTRISIDEKGLSLKAYAIEDQGLMLVDSLYKTAD